MKGIKYSLILLVSTIVTQTFSQKCATDISYAEKIERHPEFEKNRSQIKSLVNEKIKNSVKDLSGDTIIIPTVFHIIHNGDPVGEQENISEALIMTQLDQINADFNRENTDANQTPIAFQNVATGTDIAFCLTKIDEDNQFGSGIVRYHIDDLPGVSESDCWTTDYIDQNIVAPTIWDRERFMNIYTVVGIDNFDNGTCNFFASLGYAQFPGGSADTDAVILSFFTLGSTTSPNPLIPAFLGRTATHEIGHWLGLDHPWGSRTGSCNVDDDIDDTPSQIEDIYGCPSFPTFDNCTSTGNGIMYMNYMQYVDDNCMNLYTQGQKDYMRTTIETARESLITAQCDFSVLAINSITDLSARVEDNNIRLDWTQKENFQGKIYIQHGNASDALIQLEELTIDGSGATINNFIHINPKIGTHYYRILHIDSYGHKEYTGIVTAEIEEKNLFSLSPNPAHEVLQIHTEGTKATWNIIASDGLSIMEGVSEDQKHTIDISQLPKGIYFLNIKSEETSQIIRWLKM